MQQHAGASDEICLLDISECSYASTYWVCLTLVEEAHYDNNPVYFPLVSLPFRGAI